ncbi:unnamed protein product [Parnassius apollo]|uniref:(apollo) hypothetical protein n=1 Tax=Parnassius apollo TaxID=110799 RepID=A0A8S3Y0N7_PARAO|nr:unnamed protein product [Parnassius apollo]
MSHESEGERPTPGTSKKDRAQRGEFSSSEKDKHRAQKYRLVWEKLDMLKDWLWRGKNQFKAKCTVCDVDLVSEHGVLKIRASRKKHVKAISAILSK